MEFFTRETEIKPKKKNSWSKLKIKIFNRDEEGNEKYLGEYKRNYPSLYKTFFPFKKNENWYALYSPDYEETRIMKLPSCEDIGGEDSKFCPTEYYVPSYEDMYSPDDEDEWNNQFKIVEGTFGFISGCYWGDDSSWKIGYIDLSDIENGNFKIDFRFGYIEQPSNLTLKECINLYNYCPDPEYDDTFIEIAHSDNFDLKSKYLVGYPISISDKNTEEIKKLPLYNNVDLNQLDKENLIKLILKQEEYLEKQKEKMFHFHNFKVKVKQKYGQESCKKLLQDSSPK